MGLHSTGDPAFCATWSLCGLPAIALPLLQTRDRMPLGVQLVGSLNRDEELLRVARAVEELISKA